MERDFSKLIGRIVEKFGSRTAFCGALGKTSEWLSRRLNNQTQFDAEDMSAIIDLLLIDPQDIHLYFFAYKVR